MKPKLILCLALFLFSLLIALRADYTYIESVEWLTSCADQIGVYRADKVYGPDVNTNTVQTWNCCNCTADFKLTRALRGNPPAAFSRTMNVTKLDFRAGEKAVFFFVAGEHLQRVGLHDEPDYHDFFSQMDYVRLENVQGYFGGMAINYLGVILTNRSEILASVESSLKLPRASPGIVTQTYNLGDNTNYNFQIVSGPQLNISGERSLIQRLYTVDPVLIIPKVLTEDSLSKTNEPVNSKASH